MCTNCFIGDPLIRRRQTGHDRTYLYRGINQSPLSPLRRESCLGFKRSQKNAMGRTPWWEAISRWETTSVGPQTNACGRTRIRPAGVELHGHHWQSPALGSADAGSPHLLGAQGMLQNEPQRWESTSTLPSASILPGTARRRHPTHPSPPPPSTPGAFTHRAPTMCQRTSYEAVFFNLHTKKPPGESPVSWPRCAASSLDLISKKKSEECAAFSMLCFLRRGIAYGARLLSESGSQEGGRAPGKEMLGPGSACSSALLLHQG